MTRSWSRILSTAIPLFLFLLIPSGCGHRPPEPARTPKMVFADDLDYQGLDRAIEQSLIYLRRLSVDRPLYLGRTTIPRKRMIQTLEFLRVLIDAHPSPALLSRQIHGYFDLLPVPQSPTQLVTGYYRPVFEGSLTRRPPFVYPLYSVPDDLALKWGRKTGKKQIGRLQGGRFSAYWTREEIEIQNRARGHELVYLADPFQAFLVHVQGSALIRLRDGSVRTIHYAMKNGHPYRSIGRYLIRTGKISAKGANLDTIRTYLRAHPDQIAEILRHNPSFIFFQWQDSDQVLGSLGLPLTPGRSAAADHRWMPKGAAAFLRTRNGERQLNRFILIQDSGSAIKGPGRLDLFMGSGEGAGTVAGQMKDQGTLVFLLLKPQFLERPLSKGLSL